MNRELTRGASQAPSLPSKIFPLTTKCIYDPPSSQDGARILVMRFWPRGISRKSVELWFRELGTGPDLIREWKQGSIRWSEFRRAYQHGLQDPAARQAITEIRKLLLEKPVTLLCSCREEARCHRSILKQAILQQPPPVKRSHAAKG